MYIVYTCEKLKFDIQKPSLSKKTWDYGGRKARNSGWAF